MTGHRRLSRLIAYRKARGAVARLTRSLELLRDTLSLVEEDASDAENALAVELLRHGPLERDGRRYEGEVRDGCPRVAVRPAEATSAARCNCPSDVP